MLGIRCTPFTTASFAINSARPARAASAGGRGHVFGVGSLISLRRTAALTAKLPLLHPRRAVEQSRRVAPSGSPPGPGSATALHDTDRTQSTVARHPLRVAVVHPAAASPSAVGLLFPCPHAHLTPASSRSRRHRTGRAGGCEPSTPPSAPPPPEEEEGDAVGGAVGAWGGRAGSPARERPAASRAAARRGVSDGGGGWRWKMPCV